MPDQDSEKKRQRGETIADAGGALVGVGMGGIVAGPPGAVAGAVLGPPVAHALKQFLGWLQERREQRVGYVLATAAEQVGVGAEGLVGRLTSDPQREELLIQTLRVAQDAALRERVIALATALASGFTSSEEVPWETIFVRALSDCDQAHISLLATLATLEEQRVQAAERVTGVSRSALEASDQTPSAPIDPLLSTLERHGLVRAATALEGLTFGFDSRNLAWNVTTFGHQFLDRLRTVGEALRGDPGQ